MTTISSSKLKVTIDAFGAELSSIKNQNGTEYLWQADPKIWKRHAPVLFPFISGLKDGKYTYKNQSYSVPSHGFARDKEFDLVSKTESSAVFSLKADEKTLEQYPFSFELLIKYTVKDNSLETAYTVINNDDKEMYFYIGGHPGFNCPIGEGESFEDYYVEYEKNETIIQTLPDGSNRMILENERIIPLTHELFDFDSFCLDYPKSKYISLKSKKTSSEIRLDFDGCDSITVWSPFGEAPLVCLEPWSSTPSSYDIDDDLEKKARAKKLAPNGEYDFSFTITIK